MHVIRYTCARYALDSIVVSGHNLVGANHDQQVASGVVECADAAAGQIANSLRARE